MGDVKRPKQVTVSFTKELEQILNDARKMLMDYDEVRYGKQFVERELKKKKGSRYSNDVLIRMLVKEGWERLKKDMKFKYEEAKMLKGKSRDEHVIIQMIMENEMRRLNNDIFKIV